MWRNSVGAKELCKEGGGGAGMIACNINNVSLAIVRHLVSFRAAEYCQATPIFTHIAWLLGRRALRHGL
jgi:hypothetical protein